MSTSSIDDRSHKHALISIHVAEGFQENDQKETRNFDSLGGHIGAMAECAKWGGRLTTILEDLEIEYPELEYPGVFEYEVAVTAGSHVHAHLYNDAQIAKCIVDKIVEFFLQSSDNSEAIDDIERFKFLIRTRLD